MADTAALKAAASQRRAGSRPAPGTLKIHNEIVSVWLSCAVRPTPGTQKTRTKSVSWAFGILR